MKPEDVVFGKEYYDTNTGFTGVASNRTEWQNGCWRIGLDHIGKDGFPQCQTFDVEQLEPTQKTIEELAKQPGLLRRIATRSGGGREDPTRRPDPTR